MQLTQSLHRNAQQDGDRPATICGDRVWTWSESADRIARLAAGLRHLGVDGGDRVAILSLNSDRFHEYLYATWWLGAVVNPVNVRWSPTEIAYSLLDSGTKVLLVDDAFLPSLPAVPQAAAGLTVVHVGDLTTPDGVIPYEGLLGYGTVPDVRAGGNSLAGIFYTGGTTGFPKGVMLSHANLLTSALGTQAAGGWVVPGGRYLHAAPMFHVGDLAASLGRNLVGGTHVMVPTFTPELVVQAVERFAVTDALLVPTMLQMLVDSPAIKGADLSSLQRILYGASPISEAVLDRLRDALPHTAFTQAYGMTELAPVATVLIPEDHYSPVVRRSAGRAAPHAEVRVVDGDDNEVPRGTVGEIVVRGPNVMLGYWNKPQETATALRDGWMHTGDGGRMDERGYVFIVDRLKDVIVSGGENVFSAEVENALSTHPAVAACAIIGVPDPDWGERVHAVVVLQPGLSLEAAEARSHVKERIAAYKAPRSLEVVPALPMSGAGKVLKRQLRLKYWTDADRAVN